jgi:hypothetical protein
MIVLTVPTKSFGQQLRASVGSIGPKGTKVGKIVSYLVVERLNGAGWFEHMDAMASCLWN